MLFAVLFTDKPGHGQLRAEHLQTHIAWIDQNKEAILVAGSLRAQPEDVPQGGLWVVEASSKAAILDLMQSDPFFICGLRQSIDILHWNKALPDHKALV